MAAKLRRLLAVALCGLLAAPAAWSSAAKPWGIVLAASRAHVSDGPVSPGANVYDGDRLSTETAGTLQIRAASSQLYLGGSSAVVLKQGEGPACATLLAGTAIFSTARDAAFALCASAARIQALAGGPAIGQVTLVGPNELIVTSRKGALAIAVDEDTQIVPESKSYRVLIETSEKATSGTQGPRGAGTKDDRVPPPRPWRRGKFILIAIVTVGVVTVIAVREALESPDRP